MSVQFAPRAVETDAGTHDMFVVVDPLFCVAWGVFGGDCTIEHKRKVNMLSIKVLGILLNGSHILLSRALLSTSCPYLRRTCRIIPA